MAKSVEIVFDEFPEDVYTVRVSPVSVRAFFDFTSKWARDRTFAEFLDDLRLFADLAVPQKNGIALPPDTFIEEDGALVKGVVNQWISRVQEVPPPLPLGSSGTTPSPAGPTRQRNSSGRGRSTHS